ncbi:Endoglucanase 3 [Hordeum vulgare]|nr:Endoglucanase 3 [Hordeum vulgare]
MSRHEAATTKITSGRPSSHRPVSERVGPRQLDDQDARLRVESLAKSQATEEENTAGLPCFGSRILKEPFPKGFTLARDNPKYIGSTKPEDWLADYTTGGNKRAAVCYGPLMLLVSAWTFLNSLPASSVNGWLDFHEAFVCNFIGTYKRPGRPRQLALCAQGPTELLCDCFTRWTELHNSCEGVHEVQAVQCFINGCQDDTSSSGSSCIGNR